MPGRAGMPWNGRQATERTVRVLLVGVAAVLYGSSRGSEYITHGGNERDSDRGMARRPPHLVTDVCRREGGDVWTLDLDSSSSHGAAQRSQGLVIQLGL